MAGYIGLVGVDFLLSDRPAEAWRTSRSGFGFFLSNIPGDLDPQSGGVSLGKP
jgi:hypothetical protein